jgi:spore coat protein U-like protein
MRHPRLLLLAAIFANVLATPAVAATTSATTTVNVVRPVSIAKLQDMDFGTLTFAGFTGTRTITVSRTGALTCATDIVCSGVPRHARFNIQGTNKMVVLLTYSGGTLSNGVDSIPFTANGQASITMINSGAPGIDLEVGGALTISPTLVGGVYSGTMTVTADYQ